MARVAIRADSSSAIGGGHAMRCLALAEELRVLGAEVAFTARAGAGALNALVRARDFRVHELTSDTSNATRDAVETAAALDGAVDWLAVDHYELDHAWERALRPKAAKILAIDDLGREHDCDLLLDQNTPDAGAARYTNKVPAGCQLLLGPRYALLQREFLRERRRLRDRDGAVERVLVCFGASDASNQTAKAVRALAQPRFGELEVEVVAGRSNRHAGELEALCAALPKGVFRLHADDMAQLIAAADIGVGAAGSMTWERACLGLPTVSIVCAENQKAPADTGARSGATIDLGWKDDVTEDAIARALDALRGDPEKLRRMSHAGMALVDAEGARRVAETMLGFVLTTATTADSELLWRWANDAAVRAQAFESAPIPHEAHTRWYSQRLADPRCRIYVARLGDAPVGQIRFELENGRAFVDISVDREWRGRGMGARILDVGMAALSAELPDVHVVAQVKSGNSASCELFAAARFAQRSCAREGAVEFERTARTSAYNS
jgi:UDP-2,4-diacetamido-2,4,6-trideoxy-beta-L-altropyranose hydrolase